MADSQYHNLMFFLDATFIKHDDKYCKNHNHFDGSINNPDDRYKYKTLSENMDYCKSDDNCVSFYHTDCSGDKFVNCMKDGYGAAPDSKYSVDTSSSGSCLYVKGKSW